MFLFYAAKGDPAMVYACENMCGRMKKHPWIFVVSILWIAKLDSFGARDFLKQATYLFDFLQRGFLSTESDWKKKGGTGDCGSAFLRFLTFHRRNIKLFHIMEQGFELVKL